MGKLWKEQTFFSRLGPSKSYLYDASLICMFGPFLYF